MREPTEAWYKGNEHKYYIKTGEFRAPRKGEYYLSGAIPYPYKSCGDLTIEFHIVRAARDEEITCGECGQVHVKEVR